jgi:NAD(P)-dependent dehydrogenase (short-subunit alcohol dehydrogenase family)
MRALVVGSSGGIGSALVSRLGAAGAEVVGLSRFGDGLDITDEASIKAAMGQLEGLFDTVLVATGALELHGIAPEKSLRALTADSLQAQFSLNALGPALVLKHAVRLLPKDRPARFAALSARVGSIGDNALGGWYAYRAAKSALNQLIHTAAIEVARSHPLAVVTVIHPGHVATPLSLKYGGNLAAVSPDQAAGNILQVLGGLQPADTGGFFDWQGARVPW